MSPRTSLLLLGVAALLAVAVWGLGKPMPDGGVAGEQRVFGGSEIDPSQVSSIALVTREGIQARAERRQGLWWVVEPIEAPGDEEVLDQLARTLASLRSETTIEKPGDPEIYGIVPDSQRIHFVVGGRQRELEVGKKTPIGANSYVLEPASGKIFVVPTRDMDVFKKGLDDLRDSRVVRFEPSEIGRVVVRGADSPPVTLVRGALGWNIVLPFEAPADDRRVDELLAQLAFLQVAEFVDRPSEAEEARLGLPRVAFALEPGLPAELGSRPDSIEIAVAASIGGPTRLVRGGRGDSFRVAAEDVFDLPVVFDDFRRKALSRFDPASVAFYEVVFRPPAEGAVTVGMERTETGWRRMTPLAMAAGTSSRLLAVLSELDGEEIVAEEAGPDELAGLGLAPAAVTFRVFGSPDAEGRPRQWAEVHLGVDEGARGILARSSGDSRVFRIASERRRDLPIHYGAFVETFASREPSGS